MRKQTMQKLNILVEELVELKKFRVKEMVMQGIAV